MVENPKNGENPADGGNGGNIFIAARKIVGSGKILANGGDAAEGGKPGKGGSVALYSEHVEGDPHIEARGGKAFVPKSNAAAPKIPVWKKAVGALVAVATIGSAVIAAFEYAKPNEIIIKNDLALPEPKFKWNAVSINTPTSEKPEDRFFESEYLLEIDSPYVLPSYRLRIATKSALVAGASKKIDGAEIGLYDAEVIDGAVLLTIQNAAGTYAVYLGTSEPEEITSSDISIVQ